MALDANIEQSVTKNWSVLFQNFRKIVTWMKSGLESPEAMAMPEDYAITKLFKSAKVNDQTTSSLRQQIESLTAQNEELQNSLSVMSDKLGQTLQQLSTIQEELVSLRNAEPAEPKTTRKTKAKAASEPEVTQPAPAQATNPAPVAQEPDEVQLTAAAVDAGELSPDALAQVNELLGSMDAL